MGQVIPQLDDGRHASVVDEHIQSLTAESFLDGLLGSLLVLFMQWVAPIC